MQIHLFEKLSLDSKACLTWKNGINIGYRAQGHYYMALYRLNNFFVEIQYHTSFDGVACINTFACEEQLQPYLDQIDLSDIL